jgi:hypothetical protein
MMAEYGTKLKDWPRIGSGGEILWISCACPGSNIIVMTMMKSRNTKRK